jgi:hypothetical protein
VNIKKDYVVIEESKTLFEESQFSSNELISRKEEYNNGLEYLRILGTKKKPNTWLSKLGLFAAAGIITVATGVGLVLFGGVGLGTVILTVGASSLFSVGVIYMRNEVFTWQSYLFYFAHFLIGYQMLGLIYVGLRTYTFLNRDIELREAIDISWRAWIVWNFVLPIPQNMRNITLNNILESQYETHDIIKIVDYK